MADRDLLKQQLYNQLLAKSNTGDEEFNQAEDAHRLGSLASSLSRSTAMLGQVGGQPTKYDDSIGAMNDSLYKGAEDKYTKQQADDEKRNKLKLDLAKSLQEKSKKLTPIPGAVGENDQPAFLNENNEVQYLPGLKTKKNEPAEKWSDVPSAQVEEGFALQKDPQGNYRKQKLPTGVPSLDSKHGIGPDGKRMSETATLKVSAGRDAFATMEGLNKSMEKWSGIMGPVEGRLRSANPYDTDAQSFDADMRLAAQKVGKYLEDGVLRKEDEEKYRKMLPTLSNTPEVANYKLTQVLDLLRSKQNRDVQALKDQGYKTTGLDIKQGSDKTSPNAKIKVSNGKETLMIDPTDLSDANADGYQEVK